MVTMREVKSRNTKEVKVRKDPTDDTAKKIASQFLDAWIEGKSSDINKNSFSLKADYNAKKTLFKNVQLHGYKIMPGVALNRNKVGIQVDVTMDIQGKIRKKRILIYAVKIKNEWKVDMKSLIPS